MNKYTEDDVHINDGNLFNRQICVPKDMDIDTATTLLNSKDECGTTRGWFYNTRLGEVSCDDDSNRKHWCFVC